ncbi:hypothetical protein ElyMa_000222200, partial [Elysia marginata]
MNDSFNVSCHDLVLKAGEANVITEFPLPVEAIPGADVVLELIGRRLHNDPVDKPSILNNTTETNSTRPSTNSTASHVHNRNGTVSDSDVEDSSINIEDSDESNRHSDGQSSSPRGINETVNAGVEGSKNGNKTDDDKTRVNGSYIDMKNNNHNAVICDDSVLSNSGNSSSSSNDNSSSSSRLCYENQGLNNTDDEDGKGNNITSPSSSFHEINSIIRNINQTETENVTMDSGNMRTGSGNKNTGSGNKNTGSGNKNIGSGNMNMDDPVHIGTNRNTRATTDRINTTSSSGEEVSVAGGNTGSGSGAQTSRPVSGVGPINGQADHGMPEASRQGQIEKVSSLVQQKLVAFLMDKKPLHFQNPTKDGNSSKPFATQSTSGHVIELLFVVDYVLYVTFLQRNGLNTAATLLDIQTFYSQVLRATNDRYASATSGSFSVTLTLSGLFVAETAVASPWTELFKDVQGNVNPMVASPSFSSFALGLNLTFPHDLAVLFTGYNLLINSVTPSPGYTPVPGLLCSVIGVLWIQDTLDELTPLNLARFSAQSLGIQNDGVNGCSNDNLHVMSTSTLLPTSAALASNPWSFSPCSATELANMLA